MKNFRLYAAAFAAAASLPLIISASMPAPFAVPNEIQMPGTQPNEISPVENSINCSFCHANYDEDVEPGHNWNGSMMSHSSRDALFWAALAVVEQDFAGGGDFCLRCHAPTAWLDGRSEPTDGSGLTPNDFDGVNCHMCHRLVNPDDSEHIGEQNAPYIANDGGAPPEGFYGSGMVVMWAGFERLGPYDDPQTPHSWLQSDFHRRSDMCGTCHDVSNPLVGDLAHNNGVEVPLPPGQHDGTLGGPLDQKAAFQNPPYAYGVVERTYSEHQSSPLATDTVSTYPQLPAEIRRGSLRRTYSAALAASPDGNYVDGALRTFSCQSCHMRPVNGEGCDFGVSPRKDNPLHDLTGGNYWMPDAIQWLDSQNRLIGGGGLTTAQVDGMNAGKERAKDTLREAGSLEVEGDLLRVYNLTGHKLITGYPEGRRMWLRTRWFDGSDVLVREDGAYGPLQVTLNGQPTMVDTILDLDDPNTRIYEAQTAVTSEWANELLAIGTSGSLIMSFDRVTGAPDKTLADVAAQPAGSYHKTLHFVLNNKVISDNRIPPFGMSYDEAEKRNALPVPKTQFGDPGPGNVYDHWDEFQLNPPVDALRAEIELLYQPTSWEYIQFLYLANDGSVSFLASTGLDALDAWLNTNMASPVVMAEATWGAGAPTTYCTAKTNSLGCVPKIAAHGRSTVAATSGFEISCSDIRNRRAGQLLYSVNGSAAFPFQGGFLCLQPPIRRVPAQFADGTPLPANDCTGMWYVDFNAFASGNGGGSPDPALQSPGTQVNAQWHGRDSGAVFGTALSDAIEFTIGG